MSITTSNLNFLCSLILVGFAIRFFSWWVAKAKFRRTQSFASEFQLPAAALTPLELQSLRSRIASATAPDVMPLLALVIVAVLAVAGFDSEWSSMHPRSGAVLIFAAAFFGAAAGAGVVWAIGARQAPERFSPAPAEPASPLAVAVATRLAQFEANAQAYVEKVSATPRPLTSAECWLIGMRAVAPMTAAGVSATVARLLANCDVVRARRAVQHDPASWSASARLVAEFTPA